VKRPGMALVTRFQQDAEQPGCRAGWTRGLSRAMRAARAATCSRAPALCSAPSRAATDSGVVRAAWRAGSRESRWLPVPRRSSRQGRRAGRRLPVDRPAGRRGRPAQPGRERQAGTRPPRILSVARPWSRPPSVAVRERADGAHRPSLWHGRPSAMRPWTSQHNGLQRYKVTHAGTEQKRPASARIRS